MSMVTRDIRDEIKWRLAIVQNRLIGQSPEDLAEHYRLIGKQDAYKSLLKWIDNEYKYE